MASTCDVTHFVTPLGTTPKHLKYATWLRQTSQSIITQTSLSNTRTLNSPSTQTTKTFTSVKPHISITMSSNVGSHNIYEDGDQRNYSKAELQNSANADRFHEGQTHSHLSLDSS